MFDGVIGATSRFHSLARKKAKEKSTLAQSLLTTVEAEVNLESNQCAQARNVRAHTSSFDWNIFGGAQFLLDGRQSVKAYWNSSST
jgi:hypothetical protein